MENTDVMCADKPSGNKTYIVDVYKVSVHNYMLQRGVLFPSSGVGELSSCYYCAPRQSYSYGLDLWPIRYLEVGTVHIKTLVVLVTNEQAAGQTKYKYTALKFVSCYYQMALELFLNSLFFCCIYVIMVLVSIPVTK